MSSPNTSASGGYLQPAPSPAPGPLEGQALLDFVQGWVAGVSSLPGNLVRPYWQSEPPNVPQAGVAWCALRIGDRAADKFPYVGHIPANDTYPAGADQLQRHEELECLASFYDTGSGADADMYMALFRDGTAIAQNRATLTLNNFGLVCVETSRTVPSLFKQRWLYRVDLPFKLRRQIVRVYPVQDLESASGDIYTDTGLPPQPFEVEND